VSDGFIFAAMVAEGSGWELSDKPATTGGGTTARDDRMTGIRQRWSYGTQNRTAAFGVKGDIKVRSVSSVCNANIAPLKSISKRKGPPTQIDVDAHYHAIKVARGRGEKLMSKTSIEKRLVLTILHWLFIFGIFFTVFFVQFKIAILCPEALVCWAGEPSPSDFEPWHFLICSLLAGAAFASWLLIILRLERKK